MTHPTSIEAATDNRSSGSGLFSFLKTEVDSFLKGLSGRTEVRGRRQSGVHTQCMHLALGYAVVCFLIDGDALLNPRQFHSIVSQDPTTTTTTTTNNPPRKRHKRSHSEYKTYEKELDSIRQHTHKRLSGQGESDGCRISLSARVTPLLDRNTDEHLTSTLGPGCFDGSRLHAAHAGKLACIYVSTSDRSELR